MTHHKDNPCPPSSPNTTTTARLDHAVYPHIIEAILSFASTAALVQMRQTCRAVRARLRPLLFDHVLFLSDPRKGILHVLTAEAPHLHLATVDMPLSSTFLPELAHTRVLDAYQIPYFWDLSYLVMPRLTMLRRVYDDYGSMDRHRYARHLPQVATVVDRVNFTFGCLPSPVEVRGPYGTRHHVLHVAFDLWGPKVPRLYVYSGAKEMTFVLHPYTRTQDGDEGDGGTGVAGGVEEDEDDVEPQISTNSGSAHKDGFHSAVRLRMVLDQIEISSVQNKTIVVGLERLRPETIPNHHEEMKQWAITQRYGKNKGGHEDETKGQNTGGDGERGPDTEGSADADSGADAQDLSTEANATNTKGKRITFETYDSWAARARIPETMDAYYQPKRKPQPA